MSIVELDITTEGGESHGFDVSRPSQHQEACQASIDKRRAKAEIKRRLRTREATLREVLEARPDRECLAEATLFEITGLVPVIGTHRRMLVADMAIESKINLAKPLGWASEHEVAWLLRAIDWIFTPHAEKVRRSQRYHARRARVL